MASRDVKNWALGEAVAIAKLYASGPKVERQNVEYTLQHVYDKLIELSEDVEKKES